MAFLTYPELTLVSASEKGLCLDTLMNTGKQDELDCVGKKIIEESYGAGGT